MLDGYGNRGQVCANVRELNTKMNDSKSYFETTELPAKCAGIISDMTYKKYERYRFGLGAVGVEVAMLFIPLIGWAVYFMMNSRLKDCQQDTRLLLSQLRSLTNELKFKGL
jgi:hypothetical protein